MKRHKRDAPGVHQRVEMRLAFALFLRRRAFHDFHRAPNRRIRFAGSGRAVENLVERESFGVAFFD